LIGVAILCCSKCEDGAVMCRVGKS